MATPSEKLSKLAGKPVAINLKPGESLEQAEARVLKEHPQDFGGGGGNDDLVGEIKPDAKQINPYVADMAQKGISNFPLGSTSQNRALTGAKTLEDILGAEPPKKMLSSVTAEDIAKILQLQNQLKDSLLLKSKGFNKKGIDTGPVIGGNVPFTEQTLIPAGLNEAWNKLMGEGEASADRGVLNQNLLDVLNATRGPITGASATTTELAKYIFPTLPNLEDNDLTFYKKGMNSYQQSQKRLRTIMDALQRSGSADISGFKDIYKKTDEDVLNELLDQLTEGYQLDEKGNIKGVSDYDFGAILPDTTKEYLKKKKPDFKKMSDEELLNSL